MSILVFDIETVPDVMAFSKLHDCTGLTSADIASAMQTLRREKTGNDFLPHYLQKVIAISLVLYRDNTLKVWSLGDTETEERELITRFFSGIDKYMPTLVSWNGTGFDLPVLHYKALFHGISAPTYWENGENQSHFRWNNYLNRFHYRHLDLMDVLASYQNKAFAPLDDIATLLGFPGKMGMDGSKVWDAYSNGDIESIRNYCETDVLNTYCIFLKFELMRGLINEQAYEARFQQLLTYLDSQSDKAHFNRFYAHLINKLKC